MEPAAGADGVSSDVTINGEVSANMVGSGVLCWAGQGVGVADKVAASGREALGVTSGTVVDGESMADAIEDWCVL